MKNLRPLLITAIALVVLQVLTFVIPFEHTATFWWSYVFAMIGVVSQPIILKVAFRGDESLKSKFYGFPIVRVGLYYCIAQLVLSFLFMALAKYVPVQIPVVVYVLLLAAVSAGTIAADGIREELIRQDVQLEVHGETMRNLQSQVAIMVSLCDETFLPKMKAFAEEIKYSDPTSKGATEAIETDLAAQIDILQSALLEQDFATAETLLKKLQLTLTERNRLCKLRK